MRYVRSAAFIVIAAAVGLGACTSTTDGAPTFAGDGPTGAPSGSPSVPTGGPTGGGIEIPSSGASQLPSGSDLPSPSDLPSAPTSDVEPSGPPSASPSGSDTTGLCGKFSADELEQIFGAPVTTSDGDATGCSYATDEISFVLSHYDNLSVTEQLDILNGGKRTTLFGEPAGLISTGGVTVSTGGGYDAPGIITAFCQEEERPVATKMLKKVFPLFADD